MELVWLLRIKQDAQQIKQQLIRTLTEQDYKQAKVLVKRHQQLVTDASIDRIGVFLTTRE
jgi:alpha-galactosidase/6-phospho-beta-glucosidase family protein